MDKTLKWRILTVLAVLVVSFVYLMPTITEKMPSWWSNWLPDKKVGLGLDLRGGIHLVMEVDLNVALTNAAIRNADEFRRSLSRDKIVATKVAHSSGLSISAEFPAAAALKAAEALVDKEFRNLIVESQNGLQLVLTLSPAEIASIKEMTGRQALETIRNRVDEFGVSEPDIRPQGEDRIVIQLPGMDDPKRAVALIGKTALLEFKLVDRDHSVESALKNGPPAGMEILYGRHLNADGQEVKTPYLLKKQALMTGEGLVDARVSRSNQMNEPEVSITFDSRGARQFERITGEYKDWNLAIVLDNIVYSAPVIKAKIGGGRAAISGRFTVEEARDLAVILRAGSLPAPVTVLEERTVGPSLGADSITMGFRAGLTGLGLVLLFMVFYYRLSGLVACLALMTNVPIILGVLAGFGATLTLPGIFGLVLTLGMAVDANVLIFERIREEVRAGKTPKAAVSGGFGRAFWTIFDSNLTTLITALVLFQFGTGPIRGFAVTLSVGILSSMFTAIFFSRLIFDLAMGNRQVKTLSI